ncbi:MAG: pectinesterase family protein [Bacteroidia bacterium]
MRLLFSIILFFFLQNLHAAYKTDIYVAKDSSGDYTSIQEAIDNAKSFPDKRVTIHIKAGVYQEKVKVHSWNSNLSLIGEDADNTIIRWGDHFSKIDRSRNSTFHTPTLLVQAENCRLENLTIENTAGPVGQAVALAVEADRCTVQKCSIKGHQDALYAAGSNARQHYKNCYIEGTTDFISERRRRCFENCTIHSLGNSLSLPPARPRGVNSAYIPSLHAHCGPRRRLGISRSALAALCQNSLPVL